MEHNLCGRYSSRGILSLYDTFIDNYGELAKLLLRIQRVTADFSTRKHRVNCFAGIQVSIKYN